MAEPSRASAAYFAGWDARGLADAAEYERDRAALDALRASLDPDNAEAVAAWAVALFSVLGWQARYNPKRQMTAYCETCGRGDYATYDPLPDGILSGDGDNEAWAITAAALLRARAEAERP